jgi:hypothetical protein
MTQFLLLFLINLETPKNFVPLKTYISQNAKVHCKVYFINEDLPDYPRVNVIEKSKLDFFNYLDTIGIEHKTVGSYYFFVRKHQ